MYFRELEYVVTVAECRNVTAAAKKLFISQPSLSYALSKIEDDLGVKLFDRSHQPLSLTYAGEKYVEAAREILTKNYNLEKELRDIASGKKVEINIGMPTERAAYMLPRVIRRIHALYPDMEFRMREDKTSVLIEKLLNYELDFIIAPMTQDAVAPELISEPICYESIPLVASEDFFTKDMFIDESRRYVDLKALDGRPFIAIKKGHSIRNQADAILNRFGVQPKVLIEVESSNTAVQLSQCGLGATIVPGRTLRLLGDDTGRYAYIYENEPEKWPVNAVYRRDIYLNEAERRLIDLLKEEFCL